MKTENDIADPANYRNLCEPMIMADADKNVAGFFREVYELRNKWKVPDLYCIVRFVTCKGEAGSDEESALATCHCGSALHAESMTAWAFGQEQSKRHQRNTQLLGATNKNTTDIAG